MAAIENILKKYIIIASLLNVKVSDETYPAIWTLGICGATSVPTAYNLIVTLILVWFLYAWMLTESVNRYKNHVKICI